MWQQILKIRYIHEASSMRKPKSSNVLPQKKNFVKSVSKQYGNLDSNSVYSKLLKNLYDCNFTLNLFKKNDVILL